MEQNLYVLTNYRIMQIVHGGKVLRLHDLLVISGKTFAIVQQFKTPYNKTEKNSLENLCNWRLIRENRESFPPRTICIIRYRQLLLYLLYMYIFYDKNSLYMFISSK